MNRQDISTQRRNIIEHSSKNGQLNMQKMEAALNDWLAKVEDQVNQIEDSVATKVTDGQLRQLE